MARLRDKTAIVTGAGGGIGRAISMAFGREGAAVVCVDLNEFEVGRTATMISAEGRAASSIVGDVSLESTAAAAVSTAAELGGVNVIVNNAVHDLQLGPLTDISLDDWRRTFDVNLTSAFLLSKHAIPVMAAAGGGSIIHVASQLGQVGRPGRPWYCAAKSGLIGLARAMAIDHAHQGIRVNTLSPGPTETGRYLANFETLDEARASNNTLFDRLADPDEIAAGAVFLASDESSFMTGADLVIDGGYTAQ